MDRTCVQLALALVCSWSWNNSRQRLVFERNLNPKSGNLLDPFGDENKTKAIHIYIYTIHMNRRHGQSPVVGHVYMLRMMRQQRGSPASSEGSDRMGQNEEEK